MSKCQRCGKTDDTRVLSMACAYDMSELHLPFELNPPYFTIEVCKECRADWMRMIKNWFNSYSPKESIGSGIYVRELGDTIEISEEEWIKRNNL